MIRDIVFEQHYARPVKDLCDGAYYTGLTRGMASIMAIIDGYEHNYPDVKITGELIRSHLMPSRGSNEAQSHEEKANEEPIKPQDPSSKVVQLFPKK